MEIIKNIFILIVIIIHFYILYLEMFLWTTKKGIKTFGLKNNEFAEQTKVLAANQGLYNGFLAFGLVWSLYFNLKNSTLVFLSFVIIAGIYGAYSTRKINILYIQFIPAAIALLLTLFS